MSRESDAPVITVHLMGGLGNQMFQYALGRRLALANGGELVLDATGYGPHAMPDPARGIRMCDLEDFRITGRVMKTHDRGADGRLPFRRWATKTKRLFRRIAELRKPYYLRSEIVEPASQCFRFDERVLERRIERAVSVRGFWQSERYFVDIQDEIRDELRPVDEPKGHNADLADEIRGSASVGVHVRHGDNAGPIARDLGVLSLPYYERAIGQLRREVPAAKFYVFSDDGPWAKRQLGHERQFVFVADDAPTSPVEDMRLLMLCKHHILANSTFGWWGAWLGKKDGQIVYAPWRYYQNIDRPNPDLYPATWRLL